MLTTILVVWYASALASLGISCLEGYYLTVCDLFWLIVTGTFGLLVQTLLYFQDRSCKIIWRKGDYIHHD